MVLSKSFRVYHKLDSNSVYSLLLDQKTYKSESLLFEAEAIATLSNALSSNQLSVGRGRHGLIVMDNSIRC